MGLKNIGLATIFMMNRMFSIFNNIYPAFIVGFSILFLIGAIFNFVQFFKYKGTVKRVLHLVCAIVMLGCTVILVVWMIKYIRQGAF